MTIRFRFCSKEMPQGIVYFFGLRCDEGEKDEFVRALRKLSPFGITDWLVKQVIEGYYAPGDRRPKFRNPENYESYFAEIGRWPAGIGEYGIERFRADLVAAGFTDVSEAA